MTKETFINTLELLKRQQNLNCGLAQELQITLRRAFPDVYDWILWWLAKPDNFAIWTDDEPQRWNLCEKMRPSGMTAPTDGKSRFRKMENAALFSHL